MAFLDDLVTQLETDGVGTFGVNITKSSRAAIPMVPSGGATLNIVLTGGTKAERIQNNTIRPAFQRPSAQLTARANSPAVAFTMAQAAYDSLWKVRNQFIGSGWYREIVCLQEPIDMGVDDRGQSRYTFNVLGNFNRRD